MKYYFKLCGLVLFLSSSNSFAQVVNIPDPNFKAALVSRINGMDIDLNRNGEIEVSEALATTQIRVEQRRSIVSLKGLEAFTNILRLYCTDNQLTELDIRDNTKLQSFSASGNPNLLVICVTPTQFQLATSNVMNWQKDPGATYSMTCNITSVETDVDALNPRTLVRIVTLMGTQVLEEQAKNGIFIYQYSDNTKEKVLR